MRNRKLREEIIGQSDNIDGTNELFALAEMLHEYSPALKRVDKRKIISNIIPNWRSSLRFSNGFAMLFALLLAPAISTPYIVRSQPGDTLYSIKRGVEVIRDKIQPGYELPEVQESSSNNETEVDNHSSKEQFDKPKTNIIIDQDTEVDRDSPGNNMSESSSDDDSMSPDLFNQGSNNQENDEEDFAREQCKDDLEERKDSGEDITNEMFKACEDL